jgi:cytochrome c553
LSSKLSFRKNMKKTFIALILLAPTLALAQAPVAGDPVAGKVKAVAICSGCHGVPGTKTAFPEVYPVPKIGGQNATYLANALKAYKAGERYNPTMKALATALTDKEINDIAAYYAQNGDAK